MILLAGIVDPDQTVRISGIVWVVIVRIFDTVKKNGMAVRSPFTVFIINIEANRLSKWCRPCSDAAAYGQILHFFPLSHRFKTSQQEVNGVVSFQNMHGKRLITYNISYTDKIELFQLIFSSTKCSKALRI